MSYPVTGAKYNCIPLNFGKMLMGCNCIWKITGADTKSFEEIGEKPEHDNLNKVDINFLSPFARYIKVHKGAMSEFPPGCFVKFRSLDPIKKNWLHDMLKTLRHSSPGLKFRNS